MADLISLGRAKQELGKSVNVDAVVLQTLVTAASTRIEEFCRRTFSLQSYVEEYVGKTSSITLEQHPVTSIKRVADNRQPALRLTVADKTTYQDAGVSLIVDSAGVTQLRLRLMASGVETTNDVPFDTNTTVDSVVSAVGALAGWTAEALDDFGSWPSDWLGPFKSNLPARGVNADLTIFASPIAVTLDDDAGIIAGNLASDVIEARYSAGYSTIPADIQQATADLVQSWLGSDETVTEAELGEFRVKFNKDDGGDSLPSGVRSVLSRYVDRRVG